MPLLFSSQLEQQKQQQQRLQRRRASESTHLLSKSINTSLLSSQHTSNSSKYLNYKNVKRNSLVSANSNSNLNQLLPPFSSLASLSNDNTNNNGKMNLNNSEFSLNEENSFCPINLNNNHNINNHLSISFINNDLSQPIIKELISNNDSNHGSKANSVTTSITNLNHSSVANLNKSFNSNTAILSNNNNFNVASANNTPRFSANFPSQSKVSTFNNTHKQTSNIFSQLNSKRRSSIATIPSTSSSYNFNINRDILNTTPPIYTNASLNLSQPGSAFSSSIFNSSNNNNKNNNKEDIMNRNKPSNFPILQPKRKKSNSISIIEYANILNMNTNYQMLADFYDDTEVSMARLSLKTTRSANIQKQASLSEQMAALFGSSMCDCYLCKLKTIDAKKAQQHNFEIVPNKHNADFSIMKFTYSTPFSQLSCLKLYNLMNTDVSIIINNNNENSSSNSTSNFTSQNPNNHNINLNTNTTLPSIGSSFINTSNGNTSNNTSSSNPNSSTNSYHFHTNSPAIYDTRYMYLIDCRLNKSKYEKSRIQTAIHYTDLLNDTLYLSPPIDNYTLIVLYDDDGTFLTSTSFSSASTNLSSQRKPTNRQINNNNDQENNSPITSDEIITQIKSKINCSASKTFHILSGGFDQFNSKFPFMCTNVEIRSTSDRHKYLTIYPNCAIENQIYIGSGVQAKNWKIIRDLRVTHIINCSIEHECVFEDQISYFQLKIEDSYQENIYKCLGKALNFMQDAFEKYYEDLSKLELSNDNDKKSSNSMGVSSNSNSNSSSNSVCSMTNKTTSLMNSKASSPERVVVDERPKIQPPVFLIHCNLGVSRSSSILIAYLISRYKLCLYAAFKYVKDKRLQIAPNYSFLRQLKQFEEIVHIERLKNKVQKAFVWGTWPNKFKY